MTDRDRLIELIDKADANDPYECELCSKDDDACLRCQADKIADYLLANGVIVPPCKVGDKIYRIIGGDFATWEIVRIEIYEDESGFIDDSDNWYSFEDIGKTVFLTKEDAEEKLKELGK